MSGDVKANREDTFEASIVEHLTAHGWVAGDPHEYSRALGLNPDELIRFVEATQPDEWAKLVGLHGGRTNAVGTFTKRVAAELTARGTVDVLRRGVKDLGVTVKLAFFAPAHDLTPDLRALYDGNRLTVTRQVHHSESNPQDSVDLTLFINGLPVATAELKTQLAGQSMADAVHQYRYDRNPKDLIFADRTVVHFAVDQDTVAMTTKLEGKTTQFLPFNQGSNGPGRDGGKGNPLNPEGPRTAYLWEQVWARDTWLNLFASYVHIETSTETDAKGRKHKIRSTVFPRYHQWDAVEKLLARAKTDGPGRNKLVQHSAGSGKSNSIAWLAHGLARLHTPNDPALLDDAAVAAGLGANQPVFDKVIIITDRVVLDRQLQATVSGFDHTPGMIETIGKDKTSADLRAALSGHKARIIVTTLQKFPVVAQTATELAGTRFAIIADEAHSSQTGEAAKDLKAVLAGKTGAEALAAAEDADAQAEAATFDVEDALVISAEVRGRQGNLTFFAFTATPKSKTLEMFGERITTASGEPRHVAFHLYSMRQAIEEGFILDVLANYTTYRTYYRLANGLGAGDDPMLPKGKAASALARYVSLHPTNLAQKAEIIVEHFRAHTAAKIGGRAKAMVVTRSRLHAVKYWQAITKYISAKGYDTGDDPVRVLVAFSGTVIDPDAPTVEYREAMLNGFGEAALPKQFATDEFQVLIVAEKYQTGFDQPLLHTMYVDKRLDGIKAVQTLSRLNRIYPGKDNTFILDFVNDAEEITEAFQPYFAESTAAPTDPNVLYTLQRRLSDANILDPVEVDAGVEAILTGGTKGSAALNAATDPAVDRFHALDTDEDRELFRTALRDYTRTYAFLAQIMPFTDPDLEKLYYYGKYLLTRLPKADPGATVDLDESVILTHLRTELTAHEIDASPSEGSDEPLPGLGSAEGKKNTPVEAHLSELINALNERFGMDLSDADRIWFEQQQQTLAEDQSVRDAVTGNDLEQFSVFVTPRMDRLIVDRHGANDELFRAYFDKPEFRELMMDALIKGLYDQIRTEGAGA